MKDIAFTADVLPAYEKWCRTDISDADLIDGLIAGSHLLAEERDEARGQADLRLALIQTQGRELAALRLKLTRQSIALAELGERLARAEAEAYAYADAAADAPRWLPWALVVACCVALYVRLGV